MNVNYKLKYENLKSQYMNAVDTAYRLGFEAGAQQAQIDQQAQAEQQQMEAQAAQGGQMPGDDNAAQPGAGDGSDGAPGAAASGAPTSAHPEGTELDQHIAKLESMLGKSEGVDEDLKKSIDGLKAFVSAQKLQVELKKNEIAIKSIAKSMGKVPAPKAAFGMNPVAQKNMDHGTKQALALQEKIVTDIMKTWETEGDGIAADISKILGQEGLVSKE